MYGAHMYLVSVTPRVFVCVQVYVYSSCSAGIGNCKMCFKGGRQLEVFNTLNCILVSGIPVAAPYIV